MTQPLQSERMEEETWHYAAFTLVFFLVAIGMMMSGIPGAKEWTWIPMFACGCSHGVYCALAKTGAER